MTITNKQLITDALRDINVLNEMQSLPAEMGKESLRRLNQMMEEWKEDGVDFGYFGQTLTTATCPIPDWAEGGITAKLSLKLAPKYGATISIETASNIREDVNRVIRKAISERLDNTNMDHYPVGLGQYGYGYDITKR